VQRFARSCSLQLAIWAAIGVLLHVLFARPWPVSIGASLFVTLALLIFDGAFRALRERSMLTGHALKDGAWIAVAGRVQTVDPLTGPLSGESVAAYDYRIIGESGQGRSHTVANWFDGKGLARMAIVTPHGAVRIFTVPSLDDLAPADVDHSRAIRNATEHVRTAQFAKRDTAKDRQAAMAREWDDDDGVFRIDKAYTAADADLSKPGFRFEERHLKNGDNVCAFGVYSSARGGIVNDERWARRARIVRGTAEEMARGLAARAVRHVVGGLILLVPAFALLRMD
jgi:hypothetical protein